MYNMTILRLLSWCSLTTTTYMTFIAILSVALTTLPTASTGWLSVPTIAPCEALILALSLTLGLSLATLTLVLVRTATIEVALATRSLIARLLPWLLLITCRWLAVGLVVGYWSRDILRSVI